MNEIILLTFIKRINGKFESLNYEKECTKSAEFNGKINLLESPTHFY